jgi:hypothetical protein
VLRLSRRACDSLWRSFDEPDTALVLLPAEREWREAIFSRDRDLSNE